jgi:hypothetical protein
MNIKYFALVAGLAAVLVGPMALATSGSTFAGRHEHKKQEKNQATSVLAEMRKFL